MTGVVELFRYATVGASSGWEVSLLVTGAWIVVLLGIALAAASSLRPALRGPPVTAAPLISLADAGKRYTKFEDAPMLVSAALRLRARTKRSQLWAVRHVDLEVAARRVHRRHRSQRIGQVDAAADACGRDGADRRAR